ncbi:hypothetical protein BDZ91DRAFT_227688 [Kalaharituber pfeilii]|nr:hypothetical protein BDZ91DRAFT_227688 [Kalaharituber pfeilii]
MRKYKSFPAGCQGQVATTRSTCKTYGSRETEGRASIREHEGTKLSKPKKKKAKELRKGTKTNRSTKSGNRCKTPTCPQSSPTCKLHNACCRTSITNESSNLKPHEHARNKRGNNKAVKSMQAFPHYLYILFPDQTDTGNPYWHPNSPHPKHHSKPANDTSFPYSPFRRRGDDGPPVQGVQGVEEEVARG